jgi:hypothetical protein
MQCTLQGVRRGTQTTFRRPQDGQGGSMASGDWTAVGAVIVAIVACVVSVITYRLQERTQATSDEEQLNDLIGKIQGGLASLNGSGPAMTTDAYAANGVTLGTLRGQALEARKLMDRAPPGRRPSPRCPAPWSAAGRRSPHSPGRRGRGLRRRAPDPAPAEA